MIILHEPAKLFFTNFVKHIVNNIDATNMLNLMCNLFLTRLAKFIAMFFYVDRPTRCMK